MQFKIVYIEKRPEWEGKPGRLYTPLPRNLEELGEAVKTLMANGNVESVTIVPTEEESKRPRS